MVNDAQQLFAILCRPVYPVGRGRERRWREKHPPPPTPSAAFWTAGEARRQYLRCATDRLPLLYRQRRALMDDLHAVQRKVDAVDYLIRAVERASGRQR